MTARWELFSHDADIGVRGFGANTGQAFEQAALAMTAAITDLSRVVPQQQITVECAAPDQELLFAEFLNRLVYEMDVRRMLFSRFEVQIHGLRLRACVWGEPLESARHRPAVEIKGATFTGLRVDVDEQGEWRAQTVVDV